MRMLLYDQEEHKKMRMLLYDQEEHKRSKRRKRNKKDGS